MCPHTKIKPPVENSLRHMKTITHTVIGPSLFFENDNKVKEAIFRGRKWVEPFGEKGTSRVAVADIADAVAIAIRDQGQKWNGKKIMLGTLKQYTVRKILGPFLKDIDMYIRVRTPRSCGAMLWVIL